MVLPPRRGFHTGGHIYNVRAQCSNCARNVVWIQTARDHKACASVGRLELVGNRLPIERLTCATETGRCPRIQDDCVRVQKQLIYPWREVASLLPESRLYPDHGPYLTRSSTPRRRYHLDGRVAVELHHVERDTGHSFSNIAALKTGKDAHLTRTSDAPKQLGGLGDRPLTRPAGEDDSRVLRAEPGSLKHVRRACETAELNLNGHRGLPVYPSAP